MSDQDTDKLGSKQPIYYYHFAGLTDQGQVRDHNEDAFMLPLEADADILATKGYLYVLADGMGGHKKGEVASAITIETVNSHYYTSITSINAQSPEADIIEALSKAIEQANIDVMDETQGGGTTVVAAVLYSDRLVAMNVGDSRAYLLRNNELMLISKDHSLVSRLVEMGKITEEDALHHPRRNVLYQALGQGTDVDIHIVSDRLQLNDVIILCSDGLWGEVGDPVIKEVLREAPDPLTAARQLVDMANQSGGPDNITTIIVQVSSDEMTKAGYTSEAQLIPRTYVDPNDDTKPYEIPPRFEKPDTLPEET